VAGNKRFVYVLKNADPEPHFYVGLTSDVNARLTDHNAGRCPHTASRRPWHLHVVLEFSDEQRALRFERYLKSAPAAPSRSAISNREPRRPFDQLRVRPRPQDSQRHKGA
jgi:predicted GIY-YIG superfamily endonuclease